MSHKFQKGDRVWAFQNNNRSSYCTIETAHWRFRGTVHSLPDLVLPLNCQLYIVKLDPTPEALQFLSTRFPHFYEHQMELLPVLEQLAAVL